MPPKFILVIEEAPRSKRRTFFIAKRDDGAGVLNANALVTSRGEERFRNALVSK